MRRTIVAAAALCCLATAPAVAAPDIVAIILDDVGAGEIGPLAHATPSPNIDALAARGVTFTNGYSPAPLCGPSRVGTFSMRWPQEYGAYTNSPNATMPDGVVTFAELLGNAGYESWLIGKWHPWRQNPLDTGFDHFYGFIGGEHDYRDGPIMRDRHSASWPGYLTDAWTNEALAALRQPTAKPKLVVVSYNAPHTPMQQPPGDTCAETDKRCVWLAMMRRVDEGIGRIVAAAKPGTLFVLAGDNGCDTADSSCRTGPLRGEKRSLYEGGNRVPFILAWPGHVQPGRSGRLASMMDWGPTFLEAAGAPVPAWADGRSLLGPGHACLTWSNREVGSMRCGNWKIVGAELYNLAGDRREQHNLARVRPAVLHAMQAKLAAARKSWIKPRW